VKVRQKYRQHGELLLPSKKHSREAIYWQLRISNSFVTFRYQSAPAVISHFGCVRQPRAAVPDHRADTGFLVFTRFGFL